MTRLTDKEVEARAYEAFIGRLKQFLVADPYFVDPDSVEVAWATGLYEGEGSLFWNPSSLCLALGSTDLDVVQQFRDVWQMGNICGPYTKGRNKPIYQYKLYGSHKVVAVVSCMFPYLGERRRAKVMEVLSGRPRV